jgi:hypothetical protein
MMVGCFDTFPDAYPALCVCRSVRNVLFVHPMRTLLNLIAFTVLASGITAAEKPMTAFEVLKETQKQLGPKYAKTFLSMESDGAKVRPRYWWVRFYDDSLWLKIRAVHMVGPDMIENKVPANILDGGNKELIIQQEQLKYDSEKCIAFIEKAAKENGIALHALNIKLVKPHPGESNQIWTFEWLDENDRNIGKLSISATTGRVTEIVGLKIKDPRLQGVSKKKLSENVEDTFLGIGADLEEFFTGKRTIGEEEEAPAEKATEEKKK